MPKPNFFIIGAAKCATTSLASLLDQHPQAAISRPKEPHFFSLDHNYKKGMDYYLTQFDHCKEEVVIGDASTSYSRVRQHPKVIDRIKLHINKPKIIYMVRHPIRRIESAYSEQMTITENRSIKSINEAIERLPMMVDSSRYWETYSTYRKAFPKKQILVVWFEEYVNNRDKVYAEICDFLCIDNTFIPDPETEKKNKRDEARLRMRSGVELDTKWKSDVLKKTKKTLRKDNIKFLTYFKKPLDYWD